MKGFFSLQIARAGIITAILCVMFTSAAGQNQVTPPRGSHLLPLPKGGPTPRTRDGHPDLSGIWFPGLTGGYDLSNPPAQQLLGFDPKVTPEDKPPFQPWAAAKVAAMSQTDIELHRASVNCLPRGVPGMFTANVYPLQLIQTPGELVQLNELNNNWRVIPTDGHPHSKDPDPTLNGEGIGHWEGDTLVIDVIAMDERTWNNQEGWFHSDQQHVIERLSRPDANHLIYQVTIEDPKVLTRPWTSVPRHWSLGHEPLQEYYCTNNQEVDQYNELKKKETGRSAPTH